MRFSNEHALNQWLATQFTESATRFAAIGEDSFLPKFVRMSVA